MRRLQNDELAILVGIESAPGSVEQSLREGIELPKRLFEFGLIRRENTGSLYLTVEGKRVLFQARCICALQGRPPAAILRPTFING